jgi:DNA-binding CsgD family transcriptional regulator
VGTSHGVPSLSDDLLSWSDAHTQTGKGDPTLLLLPSSIRVDRPIREVYARAKRSAYPVVRSPVLSGFTAIMAAYRASKGGGMERALFGRETELATVSGFLDAVGSGPGALILGGDAGIGKSALLLDAASQARARSFRVLSCQPSESEAKLSFAALGDLLQDVADDDLEHLPAPQRSAIAVALLRAEPVGSPPDQRAISAAFHGTLLALAAERPTVLAIDDAQWLDTPSARVLEFAFRRLHDVPIGLVATARSQDLESPPLGLGRSLPDERLRKLVVGPMTLQATRDMLSAQLSARFSRSALLRIHEAAQGNPFIASELGRNVLRGGIEHDRGRTLPVPSNLVDLVKVRLSELSDGVRRVLLVISAASQPTVPLVAEAIGGRTAEEDIEAAFTAGVIGEGGGRLRPTHPLLATVLYAGSAGRTTRDIHRRLAAVVVDQEERARHLALAAEGPDEVVAAELEDAARRAHGRGASDAAAELSELARELSPSEPHLARIHRTVHAGQYAFEAADMAKASMFLEEAVDAAPAGPLRAEALLFLARVRYHSHDAVSARTLAEGAMKETGPDPALQAQVQLELVAAAEITGDRVRARTHAEAAVALAEGHGDDAALAEGLACLGLLDFLAGEGPQPGVMSRAIALEAAGADLRPLRSPTFREACILLWSDRSDAARSTFHELERRCREGGDEGSLSVILFLLAQLECFAGNWATAGMHADESLTITAWTGQQPYRSLAMSAKALIEGRCGREEGARSAIEEGLALARESGFVQAIQLNLWALGSLELALGNMKEVHRVLWPLVEGLLDAGPLEPGLLRFLPDEIEALVALGESDKARSLLETTLTRAKTLERDWALATSERGWGMLAASRGEFPEALAAFDRALEHHRFLAEPFELGRTLLAQGQAFRRAKRWGQARESLARSLHLFEQLGAGFWVDKANIEMSRIGGRAPAPAGLTPTEEQVADLVASGLTNREAAHALFLSVSAVESNLRRIYKKLGVRSRTELSRRLSGSSSQS